MLEHPIHAGASGLSKLYFIVIHEWFLKRRKARSVVQSSLSLTNYLVH